MATASSYLSFEVTLNERYFAATEFVFCYLAIRHAYNGAANQAWADFRVRAARRRYRKAAGLPALNNQRAFPFRAQHQE